MYHYLIIVINTHQETPVREVLDVFKGFWFYNVKRTRADVQYAIAGFFRGAPRPQLF